MKFSYKIFRDGDTLLAIADKEIVDKTFKKAGLEITISKDFYHGGFCDEKKALELIKNATVINAIGSNIIKLMSKNGIVDNKAVKTPAGIPHAQVVNLD